ncbi:MAG TPA: hypothetical protein VGY99_13155 [Candidatus Binataceae bacterium]|nr:hypothetical protein [Candidatus Binataceae bacterium]
MPPIPQGMVPFSLLRPGGRVFIIDCFLGRPEYQGPFNSYWHTQIGTIAEYLCAAQEACLRVEWVQDISRRTEHFWTTTLALMEAEAREKILTPTDIARHQASVRAHTLVHQGLADGGLRYAVMSFRKDHN